MPEAAEQLAHRCPWTGPGQEFIVAHVEHATPPMSQSLLSRVVSSRRRPLPSAPDVRTGYTIEIPLTGDEPPALSASARGGVPHILPCRRHSRALPADRRVWGAGVAARTSRAGGQGRGI